jgi:hypothetical protein
MVALRSERRVYLWRIGPHSTPQEAPSVALSDILGLLKDAFDNKRAFAFVDADGKVAPTQDAAENCIFIADFQTSADGKSCQLLINRGDPDVAHPSFINPAALTVKNVPPGPDEVQGWSAHMVLNLTSDATGNHRAAFERMQNVSSTLVQRYLDALLDQATEGDPKYTFEKALKRGKKTVVETRPYKLRLGINKVPSENLLEDVKTGSLTAITLIRREPQYSGPGDPTVVNSVKERLVIRTKKLEKDQALDYIKDVTQWGKNNDYDEVQFSVTDLPGNTSAHPRFAIEKADAMDTLYSRTHRITGFSKLLETCYQKIESEIADKMAAELINENLWK